MIFDPLRSLREHDRWICWSGRKIPTDPRTRRAINPLDPAAWMSYVNAAHAADRAGLRVGYVLGDGEHFCLDLDACALPDASGWQPYVTQILRRLPGAAIERSCGGSGLHVFGRCTGDADFMLRASTRSATLGGPAELYSHSRFIALGDCASGDSSTDCTEAMRSLVAEHFRRPPADAIADAWTDGAREGYAGPTDDDDLISRACASRGAASTFGTRASFRALWHADAAVLGAAFPAAGDRQFDASRADAALARQLAWWTGGHCERTRRLMLRSRLVREKWQRADYLTRTITRAVACCAGMPTCGTTPSSAPTVVGEAPPADAIVRAPILTALEQVAHFAGCVYARSVDRIVVPDGAMLRPSQFRATYGGRTFALDASGSIKTRDAWAAYTENQAYDHEWVDLTCFEPGGPALVDRDGERSINTWRPVVVPRVAGNPAPFVDHVRRMLPNDDDAEILLTYLAACVQRQGVKFTWCCLMQGAQGNGKSLIASCMRHAIGSKYVHDAKASQLHAKFNGWLTGKILILVDDVCVDETVVEILKPMITASAGYEIERKGVDQVSARICCNFLLSSNHRDAIPKTRDDRRFCVLYSAQSCAADLLRDGLTETYFRRFVAWLEDDDGYAIVSEYLATRDLDARYDPSSACLRAPTTTSTEDAISESSPAEAQELAEAVERGDVGFRGGWISSHYAHELLLARGYQRVSPRRRASLLERLGYVRHPALAPWRWRSPTVLKPEGSRSVLWLQRDHVALELHDADAIADAYTRAQGVRPPCPPRSPRSSSEFRATTTFRSS